MFHEHWKELALNQDTIKLDPDWDKFYALDVQGILRILTVRVEGRLVGYVFLLFGADGIGSNPASGWVLLVGLIWLALMTYICYRGIEVSANLQKGLLAIEAGMLIVFAVVADRGFKRNRVLGNFHDVADFVDRFAHFRRDFFGQRFATKILDQLPFDLLEFIDRLDHVNRNTNGS